MPNGLIRRGILYDERHMEWLLSIFGLVLGGALGAAATALWCASRRTAVQQELANARTRSQIVDDQIQRHLDEIGQLQIRSAELNAKREAAERQTAVLHEQLAAKQRQFDEQKRLLDDAEKKLTDVFKAAGADALRVNNVQFLELARETFGKLMKEASGDVEKKQLAIDALVKPIKELLEKHNTAVGEIEKKRETAYARLDEQIKAIATSHDGLRNETGKLVSALRRPEQRGRWGEMQLRNAVELAGMTEHCDFDEQVTVWKGDESQRPDMLVKMPGGGRIVVDSKVALDAYLDSIQQPEADRAALLDRHARHVAEHVRKLSEKQYWKQFEHAPEWVVMFMPLQAHAMQQHVLIATPTLLVALLASIACGWQREHVAANAREISRTGQELYERLAKFTESFEKIGDHLSRSSAAYNSAVGSLEGRVLPSARKLKDLHATNDGEIESPPMIDVEIRPVIAAELKLDAALLPAS